MHLPRHVLVSAAAYVGYDKNWDKVTPGGACGESAKARGFILCCVFCHNPWVVDYPRFRGFLSPTTSAGCYLRLRVRIPYILLQEWELSRYFCSPQLLNCVHKGRYVKEVGLMQDLIFHFATNYTRFPTR